MTRFLSEDFLLESPVAVDLYHRYAADLPVIDYHCHLSPEQMADNHRFASITEIWLDGDHYKWRAMRANGVDERVLHRRRVGVGEVRGLGPHRARHASQPALPLDAHGAAAAVRRRRAALARHRAGHLRPLQ